MHSYPSQHLNHQRPSSGLKITNENGESLFFGNSHLAAALNGNDHKLSNIYGNPYHP